MFTFLEYAIAIVVQYLLPIHFKETQVVVHMVHLAILEITFISVHVR